jgi:iron complex outermembrane receptor protein
LLAGISAATMSFCCGQAALAQTAPAAATVEDIVVTGTRQIGVKAADSPAPVQLVGSEALSRTGNPDLAASLEVAVPSLNIQTTGGDMAALNVQATLRGLSPNDTLVLIDGKRRHTTANLAVDGGSPYSGAATTDLSFIPVGAIDHVEVLTDGAAAQYGTDAIAGVVNIILKKANHGGTLTGQGGEYYDGQGASGSGSFNAGFDLGGKGFANVTIENRYHNYTITGFGDSRFQNADGSLKAQSYPNSNVTQAANFPKENGVNGDPQFNIYNGLLNVGYDITDKVQFYAFGTFGDRNAQHFENYRTPSKVSGVTSTGTTVYPLPLGFDPSEKIEETDFSITGGLRGAIEGWNWDVSSTYGGDKVNVYVVDSANAQLFPVIQKGSSSPVAPQRTFYNGQFRTTDLTNDINISKDFSVGLASPLNVAFGAEQRTETYAIAAGEPASYYGAGAQSFDGYTPLDAGSYSRTYEAVYGDLAADIVTGLHVDLAGRYEHYSDFGDTEVGKLTARYDFNPMIAIRGTVSTGFRAPTLAEEYYSGTNVSPYSASVQLPPNSAAAQVAGFSTLKPEKSDNYSVGIVAHPMDHLQITADLYEIDLKDRILVSGFIYGTNTVGGKLITVSQGVQNAIAARGVTLDSGLSYTGIVTFTNAADTKTQGLELTANYASDFGEYGHVDWTVGFNMNQTSVTKVVSLPTQVQNASQGQVSYLTPNAYTALTSATPRDKVILQAYWRLGKFDVNARETVYGSTAQWSGNNSVFEKIGTTGITDLEVGYKVTPQVKLDVGANNLFNTLPPTAGPEAGGRVYKVPYGFSPWGTNGGLWYGRITLTF